MGVVEPEPGTIEEYGKGVSGEGPIVMINLLRYREQAVYPEGFDATGCSGREAYQRYGAVAASCVQSVGGQPLWMGRVDFAVIAPEGESWDDAILVRYPSRKAFIDMIAQPEYQAVAPHRTAALEDSRLLETQTVFGPLTD